MKIDATEMEINSFVIKLKQLWNLGFSAHLDLDCSEGKAWVGLRLQLGEASSSYNPYGENFQTEPKLSPSKSRRSRKRADFVNTVSQSNDRLYATKVVAKEGLTDVNYEISNDRKEATTEVELNTLNMDVVQEENVEFDLVNDVNATEIIVPTEGASDIGNDIKQDDSIAVVHATVVIQNSKSCLLDRKYVDDV